jgi:hypothetical protein
MIPTTLNIFHGERLLIASFFMAVLLLVGGCSSSDSSSAKPDPSYGPDSPVTNPKVIAELAKAAYI